MENTENWAENKAIGNIAENIIEYLISSCPDWKCVKYGMENHIEELKKSLKDNQDEISRRIRTMPDFIAINTKTNQLILLDAKYRSFIDRREPKTALCGFKYAQMKDYLEFWPESYLIIMNNYEPYFMVIPIKEVKWHKHFHSRNGSGKDLIEQWNFAGIQKSIKDIFPELSETALAKAVGMIPNRKSS